MSTICLTFGLLLLIYFVFAPILRSASKRFERERQEEFRAFQVRLVKAYYPAASKFSYSELRDQFNITESYDNIGRR